MLSVWMVCGWRNANVLSKTGLPVAFMSQNQVVLRVRECDRGNGCFDG